MGKRSEGSAVVFDLASANNQPKEAERKADSTVRLRRKVLIRQGLPGSKARFYSGCKIPGLLYPSQNKEFSQFAEERFIKIDTLRNSPQNNLKNIEMR